MDDKTKTIAAITIIIGFVVLVLIGILLTIGGKKVVSPVPPESSIKIIFISPTPISVATASATPIRVATGKPTIKPTAIPTPR